MSDREAPALSPGRLPPFEPLATLVATLERAGIPCVLGGSGLSYALGLVGSVNDWDLQTDAEERDVRAALGEDRVIRSGNDALHADSKLALPDRRVEVICRFAFFAPGGIVRLPALGSGRWRGVPLASPEVWAVAYTLLAEGERSERRRERADLLFGYLAGHGADPATIAALLEQPLPPPLAARLEALPRRAG